MKASNLLFMVVLTTLLHSAQGCQTASAQNTIRLANGKMMRNVRVHKISSDRISYEQDYSLHDLPKSQLRWYETDSIVVQFDSAGNPFTQYKRTGIIDYPAGNNQLWLNGVPKHSDPKVYENSTDKNGLKPIRIYKPQPARYVGMVIAQTALSVPTVFVGALGGLIGGFVFTGGMADSDTYSYAAILGSGVGTALSTSIISGAVDDDYAWTGSLIGASAGTIAGMSLVAVNGDNFTIGAMFLPALGAVIGNNIHLHYARAHSPRIRLTPTGNGAKVAVLF